MPCSARSAATVLKGEVLLARDGDFRQRRADLHELLAALLDCWVCRS
jgi:hypothetical protein